VADLVAELQEAGITGPHIVFVDSTSPVADCIVLTREIGREGEWAARLTDRERALIRATLHLAQDRLDAANPHD
jgi:hypothetical protein